MKGIIEVKRPRDWKYFHRVPHQVYKNNPNYIFPLQKDVQDVFNPSVNKRFDQGEARCFVLLDNRRAVGRIATFIDHEHNKTQPYPIGGIGFFECINNEDYAFQLFEKAEQVLRERGVKAIDGPINFGERDRFWGLLVKGFDTPAIYQENYHPPHYQQWFEKFGFRPYEQILTFKGATGKLPFERLTAIAKRIKQRAPIKVRPFKFSELDDFAKDLTIIYNASFKQFPHFHPIEAQQVAKLIKQAKAIIDPELVCLTYYDGHPSGFVLVYPDINPLLRHAKGKLNAWTIPIFLLKNKMQKTYTAKGLGFGVHPDFKSKGIFAILIDHLSTPRVLKNYPQMVLAGIRTQNHEIRSMYAKINVEIDRVHVHFRKMLDDSIPFEPNEFIEV